MKSRFVSFRPLAWPLLAAALLLGAQSVLADPPGRVARLSYLGGDVSFAPAGEDSWHPALLNRPLVAGDRLWTGDGRVELELGTAVVRLDRSTSFEFLNLDDQLAQIQLTEGTINLRVDHLYEGQVYEIDTPTLAFVATQPGEYRLDVGTNGESTQVTVLDGYADVYGEGNRNLQVQAGMSYRFFDPGLEDYERLAQPQPDDFDQWAFARNDRYERSPARQYVSPEVIGYADLDEYGSWRHVSDHGHVWFPRRVAAGWAPYRYGRWSWIDPWGWTWVDDAPWGFAPFHYGRWVYVASGWGWVPGPMHVRPVYAPALVAFVGGSGWSLSVSTGGPPIGWFPLGPRDVYVPWYRASRNYFTRVNVHNTVVINNVYVTNVYNDYYVQGRPFRRDYTFRNAANAVTVVPRDSFAAARHVAGSMTRLRPGALAQGEILSRAPAAPTRASLSAGVAGRAAAPPARTLQRQVVARNAPAPRMAAFETRQRAIARNGGEPLAADQIQRLSGASAPAERVRLIGGRDRGGAPAATVSAPQRGRAGRDTALGRTDAQPAPIAGSARERARVGVGREAAPTRGTVPSAAPRARGDAGSAQSSQRALPSARYAPRSDAGRGRGESPSQRGIPAPSSRTQAPARSRADVAAPSRNAAPARAEQRGAPAVRERAPASRSQTLSAPRAVERRAAPAAPAPRSSAPPQRTERASQRAVAPVRESAPARRAAPSNPPPAQQRAWQPPQRAERVERSAPSVQPRAAAPARQAAPVRQAAPPVRQSAPAPERRAAPERQAPPARTRDADRDDERDDRGRGRGEDRRR